MTGHLEDVITCRAEGRVIKFSRSSLTEQLVPSYEQIAAKFDHIYPITLLIRNVEKILFFLVFFLSFYDNFGVFCIEGYDGVCRAGGFR